jgi:hypothetical protein
MDRHHRRRKNVRVQVLIGLALLITGCAADRPDDRSSRAGVSAAPMATRPSAAGRAIRWEYAILQGTGMGNYSFMSGPTIVYNGAPSDFQRFYRAIGGRRPSAAGNEPALLLEALGQQGWELVAVTRDEEFGRWYFKRPIASSP